MVRHRESRRRGRQPGGLGRGLGGECWCPRCKIAIPHQIGVPCYTQQCPKCRQPLIRRD